MSLGLDMAIGHFILSLDLERYGPQTNETCHHPL